MLREEGNAKSEKYGDAVVTNEQGKDSDKRSLAVLRYSRDDFLALRAAPVCNARPQYLPVDFNNEYGQFCPEKWLEHHWVCEGVVNRPSSNVRRKEKLKTESLDIDTTVLSPQRRGFSLGCRAPSPTKNDTENERLGANKGSWRNGAGFQLKNSGSEYKGRSTTVNSESSHIKTRNIISNTSGSGGNWHTNERPFRSQHHFQRNKQTDERVPEWLDDGPTSMLDMIELRGFDDDNSGKENWRQRPNQAEKNVAKVQQRSNSQIGNELAASGISSISLLNGDFPHSDAEFAAYIGILGEAELNSLKASEMKANSSKDMTASGSRLSRFFSSNRDNENVQKKEFPLAPENSAVRQNFDVPSSSSAEMPSNSLLNKIFADSSQRPSQPSYVPEAHLVHTKMHGVLRVEDLERNFQNEAIHSAPVTSTIRESALKNVGSNQFLPNSGQASAVPPISKGNPLCDPNQQAHLISKLNKFARLQTPSPEDMMRAVSNDNFTSSRLPVTSGNQQPPGLPMAAPAAHQINNLLPGNDAALHAAFLRSQYENALLQTLQTLATNQRNAPPLAQPPQAVNNNALRQVLANMMSNNVVPVTPQSLPMNSAPPPVTTQFRASASNTVPNAFMPTSVMLQMMKNNAAVMDEKLRPPSVVPSNSANFISAPRPPSVVPEQHANLTNKLAGEEMVGNLSQKNTTADLMAKVALQQHQYNQMIGAMQNGLPFNAWRPQAQFAAAMRAQAIAVAQAEHQRQITLALMRGDLNQAQMIRARLMSQQMSGFPGIPNVPPMTQQMQHVTPSMPTSPMLPANNSIQCTPQVSQSPASAPPHKYQNPLEKLLQSAGVSNNTRGPQNYKEMAQQAENATGNAPRSTANELPSIISRLPPSANCISVEELEKQFAAN